MNNFKPSQLEAKPPFFKPSDRESLAAMNLQDTLKCIGECDRKALYGSKELNKKGK